MKLLIITQKVDRNDPILGFFHRWIEEFAKNFEKVTVICLEKGQSSLPDGVKVLSLGKEEGRSKLGYLVRLYKFLWRERSNYDAVFVHMNQEYMLLAGWLWRLLGKDLYMWRNHYSGSFLTDIAASFCRKVFCTSRHSYTAKYDKTAFMPVGVDTDAFKTLPGAYREPGSVLFLSRMSRAKRPHILVDALQILSERGVSFKARFYGSPRNEDELYYRELQSRASGLDASFHKAVPNHETPEIYNQSEIFVNCSPSGMFDKTIFEAASCGCLVLASSKDWAGLADERFAFPEGDAAALADSLESLLKLSDAERERARDTLGQSVSEHTLAALGRRLAREMS